MNIAIEQAKEIKHDIPVCAIIVKENEIISIKTNEKEKTNRLIAHAEILAIDEANSKLSNWRLNNCDMYVTLEPCIMCAWAILTSRIDNLYFGSYDLTYGGFSTSLNLKKILNSKINVKGGMEEDSCNKILEDYFRDLRNEK